MVETLLWLYEHALYHPTDYVWFLQTCNAEKYKSIAYCMQLGVRGLIFATYTKCKVYETHFIYLGDVLQLWDDGDFVPPSSCRAISSDHRSFCGNDDKIALGLSYLGGETAWKHIKTFIDRSSASVLRIYLGSIPPSFYK